MSDGYAECERAVREGDKGRFLATLFAPADPRPSLFALYAFDLELAAVALRAHEPLAGEIRLQWWRDMVSGRNPPESPVAVALADTIKRYEIAADAVLDMIDARSLDIYADSIVTLDDLERYADRTAGAVYRLAAQILVGGVAPDVAALARHAGIATVATRYAGAHASALEGALPAALQHLAEAKALIGRAPDEVLPAFLPLALVRAKLDLILWERAADDLPQWRQQWTLWRASKSLARWM